MRLFSNQKNFFHCDRQILNFAVLRWLRVRVSPAAYIRKTLLPFYCFSLSFFLFAANFFHRCIGANWFKMRLVFYIYYYIFFINSIITINLLKIFTKKAKSCRYLWVNIFRNFNLFFSFLFQYCAIFFYKKTRWKS